MLGSRPDVEKLGRPAIEVTRLKITDAGREVISSADCRQS